MSEIDMKFSEKFKYVIGIEIETDEQISFNSLLQIIKDHVTNGNCRIVSAEAIEDNEEDT